ALHVLGRLRPVRLLNNARALWEGKRILSRRQPPAKILDVQPWDDNGQIVELSTTSGTLIANGFLCHNTDSAYTESLSFLPQSTGADIVFRCMIALMWDRIGWKEEAVQRIVPFYRSLPRPANLLVQVHDSLVGDYPLSVEEELMDT